MKGSQLIRANQINDRLKELDTQLADISNAEVSSKNYPDKTYIQLNYVFTSSASNPSPQQSDDYLLVMDHYFIKQIIKKELSRINSEIEALHIEFEQL